MVGDLVKTRNFVSPLYSAAYKGVTKGGDVDRPDRIHFHEVPEDGIIGWLKENALYVLRDPFPEQCSSWGYFFTGKDGTSNIVSPKVVDADRRITETSPRNYNWRLIIKSQPPTERLSRELTDVLEEMGYQEVESFN